ncbi:MAG: histidinol dehydrogenase [Bacteroidetes bacterium]|nr:MAG: histidinol dehydrogenase [Bacteroidota bacterium]
MKQYRYPARSEWQQIIARPAMEAQDLEARVRPILEAVRSRGDEALKEFTERFDKVHLSSFRVSEAEFEVAESLVSEELKKAIAQAYHNISAFHHAQREGMIQVETMPGVLCWRKSVPIEKVGLYIPGGTAPLFSTLLMLGTPAKIAGCSEIVLCTPPGRTGTIHPAILYTAALLGIRNVIKAGGAQAIAAMAYGTETVPQVHKILGPGNQYVTLAKQLASRDTVAIDMPAGPSEVAIIADKSAHPAFVAADLLSQAEHGIDSQVLLVSDSEEMLKAVEAELYYQLESLPRRELAAKALENSRSVLLGSLADAMELINQYAPEHLILSVENDEYWAAQVQHAGSVFLGNYAPESAGDYASGTNHTLPTNGYARAYSGVSLDSFIKKITFQKITPQGLSDLGPAIIHMARAEELEAHARAVSLRLDTLA